MLQNESLIDRVIRLVLGAILIYAWYAAFVSGFVAAVGVILLVTGIIGWCPIYSLLGGDTHHFQA